MLYVRVLRLLNIGDNSYGISTRNKPCQGHTASPAHNVRILPGSPLSKLVGKEYLKVNSSHHQGINRLAKGLEIMALADDSLVEAVYMPERPDVWAVQWHPECSLKDEISKKIFSIFLLEKNI